MLDRTREHTSVVAYIDWIQSVIREKTLDGPRHPALRELQYYGFNPAPIHLAMPTNLNKVY